MTAHRSIMPPASRRRCSRARALIMAWLGLGLLLLNALVPALVPATPTRAGTLSASLSAGGIPASGEQIVICTPSGLRLITVDAQGQPVEQQDSTREGYCVFCLPLVHAASGALAPLAVDPPPPPVVAALDTTDAAFGDRLPLPAEQTFAQSRAPPVVLS